MAVFTPVNSATLNTWLSHYALGEVRDFRGIASGIENSNFFLTTTRGDYVLTIFEKLRSDELPFYLDLMQHLAAHGIPVPDPIPRADGTLAALLEGKPAAIVSRLPGTAQLHPGTPHCAQIGETLARCHLAGRDFAGQQPNLRSLSWWQAVAPQLLPHLDATQSELLRTELAYQQAFFGSDDYRTLPEGPCHCDLFRDNVLFVADPAGDAERDRLGGFFDFYFAGCDKWLFDLAVTVNDWCVDVDSGVFDTTRLRALLDAYQAVRPLTQTEQRHWQDMLRAAAFRFWVSRLFDLHQPREAALLQAHDPGRFERMLRERIVSAIMP